MGFKALNANGILVLTKNEIKVQVKVDLSHHKMSLLTHQSYPPYPATSPFTALYTQPCYKPPSRPVVRALSTFQSSLSCILPHAARCSQCALNHAARTSLAAVPPFESAYRSRSTPDSVLRCSWIYRCHSGMAGRIPTHLQRFFNAIKISNT